MNAFHHTDDSIAGPERAELLLADGVVLVADVYRPQAAGLYPVLLMRQPYGRAIASTVVLAHPAWYAEQGYIVVVQDVRGTGGSGGDFRPFVDDLADGAATLDWAVALPGSSGRIGMYGFSYQAVTQYLALAGGGRRPDAIAPAMSSWRPRQDWAYDGDAFRQELCVYWALQMALLKARLLGDSVAVETFTTAEGLADIEAALIARPDLSHLAVWKDDDPHYWRSISPGDLLTPDSLNVPVLHVGGWNDYMLGGTLAAHAAFSAVKPTATHLVIGPWAHIPWGRLAGATDMGPDADFSVDRAQVAFFDYYLKDRGERPEPVRSFDMGFRGWTSRSTWPDAPNSTLFLTSSGLAATQTGDGRLLAAPGLAGADRFVADPVRPAPLIGGAVGTPPGFADRTLCDARSDVAVYTTIAADRPMVLFGPVTADIVVDVDSDAFDLCATLSLVTADGAARVLATGMARRQGHDRHDVFIDLKGVSATVPPGGALRLSLQGTAVPAFQLQTPGRPVTYCIRHGGARASRLSLSLLSEDQALGR